MAAQDPGAEDDRLLRFQEPGHLAILERRDPVDVRTDEPGGVRPLEPVHVDVLQHVEFLRCHLTPTKADVDLAGGQVAQHVDAGRELGPLPHARHRRVRGERLGIHAVDVDRHGNLVRVRGLADRALAQQRPQSSGLDLLDQRVAIDAAEFFGSDRLDLRELVVALGADLDELRRATLAEDDLCDLSRRR